MKKLISLISIVLFSVTLLAQPKETLKKGTDEYKIFWAKQDFFGGNYRSSVNKFKEVVKNRPNDANVHFWIGNCYCMMQSYQDAIDELEKAKSLDPNANYELELVLGKAYHMRGMIDKALESFSAFRKTIADSPKKIAESEVDLYISQCTVAKQQMASPVNVQFTFLLDVNSQYDDKGPILTNGEKTIIFASRRPAGGKSKVDTEGDFGYYDDVYESNWSEEKRMWLAADLVRGPINGSGYDAATYITPDGTQMLLYKNDQEAVGGEIFFVKKSTSGKWRIPEMLEKTVNTSYYEDSGVLSPDGKILYFISERPGGLGHGDVWVSKKGSEGWGEAVNLGAPVNTPYDENGLHLSADGKTLFFCSNGPNSMGQHDIFRTTMEENGKWSKPVNLGYPINSVSKDSKLIWTSDKKTGYLSSVRDSGLGDLDIIRVDLSNYDVMTGVSRVVPQMATLTGKVTTADSSRKGLQVQIRILDKATGMQAAMTKSSEDGSYTIEFPANKPSVIEVISEGYQTVTQEILLAPGKLESKDIALPKNN